MPSPFPGMDPYLEPHWLDVHTKLVAYASDALNNNLPQDLIASTEERVAVESDTDERLLSPDIRVFEPIADSPLLTEDSAEGGAVMLPFRLLAQVEPIIERFIRIVESRTERLVTVVEFVSPTNKRGDGLHGFRSKRAQLLAAGVNFVEVDLVRAGDWRALLRPHFTRRRATLYRATVRVPRDPGAVYLQPIRLQDKLPDLHIPLRPKDPRLMLELQPLVDSAYDNGRYARRIDYHADPVPPLESDDTAWADQLLRAQNRR